MLDILQLVKQVGTDNAILYALERGKKVVELDTKVVFTDDTERMAIYFTDDSKSAILRVFI